MYLGRYRVIELPAKELLHWVLNPGIALNELVLGQRSAARILVDETLEAPLVERLFIECRSCRAVHPSRVWAMAQFGNWFGIVCPKCEAKIPTVLNVFSILLLIPTAPVWVPLKLAFERTLHQRQLLRIRSGDELAPSKPLPVLAAIGFAAVFGIGMFLFFTLVMPRFAPVDLTFDRILIMALMCALGGLLFGFLLRAQINRRLFSR